MSLCVEKMLLKGWGGGSHLYLETSGLVQFVCYNNVNPLPLFQVLRSLFFTW